jgi:hypothetical protein
MQEICLFHQYIKVKNVRIIYKVNFHLKMRAIQRGARYTREIKTLNEVLKHFNLAKKALQLY